MSQASPSACFQLGFALGSVVKKGLKELRHAAHNPTPPKQVVLRQAVFTDRHPSGELLETMCQVPAIVRLKGVNLQDWYQQNTRELPAKPKRRSRAKAKRDTDKPAAPKLGSLDQLIAPIEPLAC